MTFEQWGHTVCVMDQVRSLELNYVGLIDYAKNDTESERYLGLIVNTYGTKGSGEVKRKDHPSHRPCFVFRSFWLACGESIPAVLGGIPQHIERLRDQM